MGYLQSDPSEQRECFTNIKYVRNWNPEIKPMFFSISVNEDLLVKYH